MKQVSTDELYRRSTQYNLWSFSKQGLALKRHETRELALKKAREKLKESKARVEIPTAIASQIETIDIDPPTEQEEQDFLRYYAGNVMETADFFRMPTQVKATAVLLFKRFYLSRLPTEFHPKHILYTCLFLLAKLENYFMSIDLFVKPLPNTEPHHVLDLEFVVLQELQFTLLVHHPFRPLYGFFLDMQAVLQDESVEVLGTLYDEAKKWCMKYSLVLDVAFLYTPPQIALAAMYAVNLPVLVKYLKQKFPKIKPEKAEKEEGSKESNDKVENNVNNGGNGSGNSVVKMEDDASDEQRQVNGDSENSKASFDYQRLGETLKACVEEATGCTTPSREESTAIDKKIYFVLNPERLVKRKIKQLSAN